MSEGPGPTPATRPVLGEAHAPVAAGKSLCLYCHCAFARVVPDAVKEKVLEGLLASGEPFEAVADLCELSARRDPSLAELAKRAGNLRIAACFPRAVRGLFEAAGSSLPLQGVHVANMREASAEDVLIALLGWAPSKAEEVS